MPGFNPNDYEPVEARLAKFWTDHHEGRIVTELIRYDEPLVIVRADVYRDEVCPVTATGYAQETIGVGNVNKTSALENCETSAIGRALANLGYAPKGARPSREEMIKAQSSPAPPAAAGARTVEHGTNAVDPETGSDGTNEPAAAAGDTIVRGGGAEAPASNEYGEGSDDGQGTAPAPSAAPTSFEALAKLVGSRKIARDLVIEMSGTHYTAASVLSATEEELALAFAAFQERAAVSA